MHDLRLGKQIAIKHINGATDKINGVNLDNSIVPRYNSKFW